MYHVSEVVRQEVDAERMYILSYGSNQANAHVHWHIAPLPKGVPYEKQQGAAIGWSNGVLRIPEVEMDALAKRLEIALKKRVTN